MAPSHIVVDGSNIATEGRSLPSLQQLLEAVEAVVKDQKPDTVTVIVDATFGHRIDKDEREAYDAKVANSEIITPPAGVIGRGDAFILEVADRADAVVLSNDSFQEFHGEYRWLFDEGRLLGGKHVPGVGWIFLDRSPVRGAVSRKATSAAKRKRKEASKKPASGESKGPSSKPKEKAAAKKGGRKKAADTAPRSSGKEPEPYNELMPFLDFVGAHEVGSTVAGEIEQFSSHGAYVMVGPTRCYVALKSMGDPPPRSARDVVAQGETRTFRVEAIDTPRRGIDLSLVGAPVSAESPDEAEATPVAAPVPDAPEAPPDVEPVPDVPRVSEADLDDPDLSVSQRRKLRAALAAQQAADAARGAGESVSEALAAEEAAPSTAKTPRTTAIKRAAAKSGTKKPAARKATTKKSATKKSAAKKSAAKKAASKKPVATKSTTKKAAAEKAASKSAAKKTTTATKAAATKAAATKAGTTTATAEKTTARKTAAKKAGTTKAATTATAKKTTVKKAAVKKAATKKAASKKPVATKSATKKSAAKKTSAKKTSAKKSTAKTSAAKKSSPRQS